MSDVKKHTFNQGVDTILKECLAISDQRGGEYEDSWNLKNVNTPVMSHVLRLQGTFDGEDEMLNKRWRRLLLMAALMDVKLSRLIGSYKDDTFIDLINYAACFSSLMREWQATIADRPSERITADWPTTFNDDVMADLKPHPYSPHSHVGDRVLYPDSGESDQIIRNHMAYEHRQDGTAIYSHRADHANEGHAEATSGSYMDSEFGPSPFYRGSEVGPA